MSTLQNLEFTKLIFKQFFFVKSYIKYFFYHDNFQPHKFNNKNFGVMNKRDYFSRPNMIDSIPSPKKKQEKNTIYIK